MCLWLTEEGKAEFEKISKGKKVLKLWKVLRASIYSGIDGAEKCYSFYAPFFDQGYGWGEQKSNRPSVELTNIETLDKEVKQGFHVLLTKEDAEKVRQLNSSQLAALVIVPVYCNLDDFVAAGGYPDKMDGKMIFFPSAVFTKLTIRRKDWNAAQKDAAVMKKLQMLDIRVATTEEAYAIAEKLRQEEKKQTRKVPTFSRLINVILGRK